MGCAVLQVCALLLAALCAGTAGIRVLESPPFNCSQEGLRCHVTNSNCIHKSWLRPYNLTPSAPSVVNIGYSLSRDENGHLVPTLDIQWKVATDASILHLQGAQLLVLQKASNQQVCVQFEFEDNFTAQQGPDGERWHFVYNRFIVNPGIDYEVTVYHLPKLGTNGDQNQKSKSYKVPGCKDHVMATTWPCELAGKHWKPNIAVDVEQDSRLSLSFNSSYLSTEYHILVQSFLPGFEKFCKKFHQNVSEVGPNQRLNIPIHMKDNMKSCCSYEVQIWGLFPICGNDCTRISTTVLCPTIPPPPTVTPGPTRRDHWYVTAACALLVGISTAGLLCMVLRPATLTYEEEILQPQKELLPSKGPPPSKIPKVWIVYSADHALYVKVVLKLADFLRTRCGTDVVLDLLDQRTIETVGIMPWLTSQKQEVENQFAKIIILCSKGVKAKWQAMQAADRARVSLKQDRMQPSGDLLTAALNLFMHDFQFPANFGKYIIAYFNDIGTEGDIPEPFKATSKYQLMKDFEEVFFRIQDMEQYEHGRMSSVEEVTAQNYARSESGQGLQKAICKFKELQQRNPDWFNKECLEVHDNEEEDLDVEVPWDPASLELRTLELQPVVNVPEYTGCLSVSLDMQEADTAVTMLEPLLHFHGDYGQTAYQTDVYVSNAGTNDLVQRLEPGYSMEFENATRQQLPCQTDRVRQIGAPLTHASSAMMTDPHLNGDLEPLSLEMGQNGSLVGDGDLSDELKRNLEQLMHYQVSVIVPFEEQQLVLKDPCESLDEQGQSLQSDQGYCTSVGNSPLPHEAPGDLGITPQDLEMVKAIQAQLFIQTSGWGTMSPL